jgi:hypothetical protein
VHRSPDGPHLSLGPPGTLAAYPVVGYTTVTQPVVGTFISMDHDVENFYYRILVRTTINAIGDVKVDFVKFEIFCR